MEAGASTGSADAVHHGGQASLTIGQRTPVGNGTGALKGKIIYEVNSAFVLYDEDSNQKVEHLNNKMRWTRIDDGKLRMGQNLDPTKRKKPGEDAAGDGDIGIEAELHALEADEEPLSFAAQLAQDAAAASQAAAAGPSSSGNVLALPPTPQAVPQAVPQAAPQASPQAAPGAAAGPAASEETRARTTEEDQVIKEVERIKAEKQEVNEVSIHGYKITFKPALKADESTGQAKRQESLYIKLNTAGSARSLAELKRKMGLCVATEQVGATPAGGASSGSVSGASTMPAVAGDVESPSAKLVPAMADEAPLASAVQLAQDAAAAFPHPPKGPKPQAAGAPKGFGVFAAEWAAEKAAALDSLEPDHAAAGEATADDVAGARGTSARARYVYSAKPNVDVDGYKGGEWKIIGEAEAISTFYKNYVEEQIVREGKTCNEVTFKNGPAWCGGPAGVESSLKKLGEISWMFKRELSGAADDVESPPAKKAKLVPAMADEAPLASAAQLAEFSSAASQAAAAGPSSSSNVPALPPTPQAAPQAAPQATKQHKVEEAKANLVPAMLESSTKLDPMSRINEEPTAAPVAKQLSAPLEEPSSQQSAPLHKPEIPSYSNPDVKLQIDNPNAEQYKITGVISAVGLSIYSHKVIYWVYDSESAPNKLAQYRELKQKKGSVHETTEAIGNRFAITQLEYDTTYAYFVQVRQVKDGPWSAEPSTLGQMRQKKTLSWIRPTGELHDKPLRECWDKLYGSSDTQQRQLCLLSADKVQITKYGIQSRPPDDPTIATWSSSEQTVGGHIIAHTFGGPWEPWNLVPIGEVANSKQSKAHLIDYMIDTRPNHLHELCCRLKKAHAATQHEKSMASWEFVWHKYSGGVDDDQKPVTPPTRGAGAMQKSYEDLVRACCCPAHDTVLNDSEMFKFIQDQDDIAKKYSLGHEKRGALLYPEDFRVQRRTTFEPKNRSVQYTGNVLITGDSSLVATGGGGYSGGSAPQPPQPGYQLHPGYQQPQSGYPPPYPLQPLYQQPAGYPAPCPPQPFQLQQPGHQPTQL